MQQLDGAQAHTVAIRSIAMAKAISWVKAKLEKDKAAVDPETVADLFECPCLGRPFQLGMLYDCRNDKLIPGVTLWGSKTLRKKVSIPQPSSDFEVIAEDTLDQKALQLDIHAELKLSLLLGMVQVEGAAKFLTDRKTSTNQARVSMKYKSTSTFEQLTMSQLAKGKIEFGDAFENDIATHVVTAVLYGADAFFVFDKEVKKGEELTQIQGNLKAKIDKLPSCLKDLQVSGETSLVSENTDKHESLKCTFHGDVILPKNPTTFEDAIATCQKLPELIRDGKSVPKKVWLYPLEKLNSKVNKLVCKINARQIDEVQEVMEALHEIEVRYNDLLKNEVCTYFSGIKDALAKLSKVVNAYRVSLEERLAALLPQIRGGAADGAKLADVLYKNNLSPFSHQCLSTWISGKETEVEILTGHLQNLNQEKNVQFAFAPGKLDVLSCRSDVSTILCFDFNITHNSDGQLEDMEAYLRTGEVSHAASNVQSQAVRPWYKDPDVKQAMKRQIRYFLSMAQANSSRQDVLYVVTSSQHNAMACTAESSQLPLIVLYEHSMSSIFDPPDQPGKPHAIKVTQDSIQLKWDEPTHGANNVQSYTVCFRSPGDLPNKWRTRTTDSAERELLLSKLTPETRYKIKVRAETVAGAGPDSDLSDPIETKATRDCQPALRILHHCKEISSEGTMSMYQLPLHVIMDDGEVSKVQVGLRTPEVPGKPEKVLMIVGATGVGKSTLINGIANYVLGVRWEDDFRFKLISEIGAADQSVSQTKCITAYTFPYMEGSPLTYTLTVVDTPGFGDTEGLQRDKYLITLIQRFFSSAGSKGIDHLNGIGFVSQAPTARLTPTQRYIFNAILSIFGNDVEGNIYLLTTFADGQQPPVLDAIKAAGVPYQCHFKFNNSALFATNKKSDDGGFDAMFWQMGTKSFASFFDHFRNVEPKSLTLTREVLHERGQMEAAIQGLQPQIRAGLTKIDELKQEEQILRDYEKEILTNKDFTYEVQVTKQRLVKLSGVHTTTCLTCNYTCHDDCAYGDDDDKYLCSAMHINSCTKDARCGICPKNCSWELHKNYAYRIELYPDTETRTSDDLKARYESALNNKSQVEGVIKKMEKELNDMNVAVLHMIAQVKCSIQRLREIALKPNPLTEVGYIDLLIESEKQEAKHGWLQRVQVLNELREKAELISKIMSTEATPDKLFEEDPALEEEPTSESQLHEASAVAPSQRSNFRRFIHFCDKTFLQGTGSQVWNKMKGLWSSNIDTVDEAATITSPGLEEGEKV